MLAATILASSMAFIDSTVTNVALPALQTSLNGTAADLQWVVEAYALLLSAFLLIGGSLGDHFGRRRIFLIGVALFALASAGCGMAANIGQLIAARAFQGLAAALLIPGSLAIISITFSDEERGRAIGTWSAFSAITAGLGPLLGGWLIEHLSWRAVFFINLPLAFAVILISLRHVEESADEAKSRIDWLGAILAAVGLGALVYGLIESSRIGSLNQTLVVVLISAGVIIAIFLFVEGRMAQPMLPLDLFRSRTFAGANLLTFFLYAALSGSMFFLPLNLIQVQGYTATQAGASLLPFILIMSLLSRWAGGLITKYGPKIPLVVGPLIAAGGFVLFTVPSIGGSYWTHFFPAVAVLGLGMAISVAPLTTTVMNSAGRNRVGIASAVNNAVARTAGLLAVAVLGLVMLHVFTNALERHIASSDLSPVAAQSLRSQRTKLGAITAPNEFDLRTRDFIRAATEQSFVSGFRIVMAIGASLAVLSAMTSLVLIRTDGRISERIPAA